MTCIPRPFRPAQAIAPLSNAFNCVHSLNANYDSRSHKPSDSMKLPWRSVASATSSTTFEPPSSSFISGWGDCVIKV